jgi:hypothetical protein
MEAPLPATFRSPAQAGPKRLKGTIEKLSQEQWDAYRESGVAFVPGPDDTWRIWRTNHDEDFAARLPSRKASDHEALDEANRYFRSLVYDAMEEALPDPDLAVTRKQWAAFDGDYISHNDWGALPDGEGYLRRAAPFLGPDVRQAVADVEGRIAQVWEDFDAAYPAPGGATGDLADAARNRRLSQSDPGEPDVIGMLPSEIAEIIGIDNPEVMRTLRSLDQKYHAGTLTPSEKKLRHQMARSWCAAESSPCPRLSPAVGFWAARSAIICASSQATMTSGPSLARTGTSCRAVRTRCALPMRRSFRRSGSAGSAPRAEVT